MNLAAMQYWASFHFSAASGTDAQKRVIATNNTHAMAPFRGRRLLIEQYAATLST